MCLYICVMYYSNKSSSTAEYDQMACAVVELTQQSYRMIHFLIHVPGRHVLIFETFNVFNVLCNT